MHVPALAAPHRQRRAPVALARERPVDVVAEPVAEAPVLDVRRVPGDRLVGRRAARRAASSWRCTTTVWRSTAAACRSASSAGRSARTPRTRSSRPRASRSSISSCVSSASLTKRPAYELAVAAEHALVVGAVRLDRVVQRARLVAAEDPRRGRHAVVVLAERRRQVHDAGAVLRRHEVVGEDRQRARLAVARREDRSLVGAVARDQLLAR